MDRGGGISPPRSRSRKGNGPNRKNPRNDAERARKAKRLQTAKYIEENRKRKLRCWEELNEKGLSGLTKAQAKTDLRELCKDHRSESPQHPAICWSVQFLNENTNETDAGPFIVPDKKNPPVPADRSSKAKKEWIEGWLKDPAAMLVSLEAMRGAAAAARREWRRAQGARLDREGAYHAARAHLLDRCLQLHARCELLDGAGQALQQRCLEGSDLTATRGNLSPERFPMREVLEVLCAQLEEIRSLERDNAHLLGRLRRHQAALQESKARAQQRQLEGSSGSGGGGGGEAGGGGGGGGAGGLLGAGGGADEDDEDVTEFDCFFDMEVGQPAWTPYGRGTITAMRADDEVVEVALAGPGGPGGGAPAAGRAYLRPADVLPAGGARPPGLPLDRDLLRAWEAPQRAAGAEGGGGGGGGGVAAAAEEEEGPEETLARYERALGRGAVDALAQEAYEREGAPATTHAEDDLALAGGGGAYSARADPALAVLAREPPEPFGAGAGAGGAFAFPRARLVPAARALLPLPAGAAAAPLSPGGGNGGGGGGWGCPAALAAAAEGVQWRAAALPRLAAEEAQREEELEALEGARRELAARVAAQARRQARQRRALAGARAEIAALVARLAQQHQPALGGLAAGGVAAAAAAAAAGPSSFKSLSPWRTTSEVSDVASDSNTSDVSQETSTESSIRKKNRNNNRRGGKSGFKQFKRSNSRQ